MSISIEQLLNIPGVEVLKTEISQREISIHLKIESNYTRCHQCGEKATAYYCDGEMLRLRHLPIFERPVDIYLQTKRYRCLNCDDRPTSTQQGDWYDLTARCTKAYAKYLLRELVPRICTITLERAAEAYARMLSGDAQFRVVLTM